MEKPNGKKNPGEKTHEEGQKNKAMEKIHEFFSKNKKLAIISCSVVGGIIVIAVAASLLSNIGKDYKVVDLTEMTVAEACNTAQSHGWKVQEPISATGYESSGATRQIDCSNSTAKVSDYDYYESKHEVKLHYNHKISVVGQKVSEALSLLKATGWKEDGIELLRCNTNSCSSGKVLTIGDGSYDENEPVKRSSIEGQGKMYVFLEPDGSEEEPAPSSNTSNSSSTSNDSSSSNNSSSSSSSSSNTSSSDMCKPDYQKDLDAAKTAYEAAKNAYDTYKNLGVDASTLETYQSALDLAKTSLDAAQKIYDTYCK